MLDANKKLMVAELRIGIPVGGYNLVGQASVLRNLVENIRDDVAAADPRAVVVLDRVEFEKK